MALRAPAAEHPALPPVGNVALCDRTALCADAGVRRVELRREHDRRRLVAASDGGVALVLEHEVEREITRLVDGLHERQLVDRSLEPEPEPRAVLAVRNR